MQIRELTEEDVRDMQSRTTTPNGVKSLYWHEGVSLIGYWRGADSYVFLTHRGGYLCLSRGYIEKIVNNHMVPFATHD